MSWFTDDMKAYEDCPTCPACGRMNITVVDDMVRNLKIVRCNECGECFAVDPVEIFRGNDVTTDWAIAYHSKKRLEALYAD